VATFDRNTHQVLETQFPETVEAQPELAAYHCTEAGITEKAVHYWQQARQRAIERSAHVESISHLTKGLEVLQTLPETRERVQQDVDMLIALGTSLRATKGHAAPEVGQTYTRARQFCQHLDDPHQLFPVLHGLHNYYLVRAELQTAHTLGEQLLTLAQHTQDSGMLMAAHRALGSTLFFMGASAAAHTHYTQGIALYDAQQHHAFTFLYGDDAGVVCRTYDARVLWHLGYPVQGLTQIDEAVTQAHQGAHPFSLGTALSGAAIFHQFRREVCATQEHAAAAIRLAIERGFPHWRVVGSMLRGWALVQQGQTEEGIAQLHQGLTALRATGTELARPYFLALLAEAYGTVGEPEAGLTVLMEALKLAETTGERWYESEYYRLKGELLLQHSSDNATEAESCFSQAISIAQSQQAKSWELRAATSLARLWQSQGKHEEARQVLGDVYGWFTEGFDTLDLRESKALLDELA
jgi:predicted ATPase